MSGFFNSPEWRWIKRLVRVLEISALVLSTLFAAVSTYYAYRAVSLTLADCPTRTVTLSLGTYNARSGGSQVGEYQPLAPCKTELTYVSTQTSTDCQSILAGSIRASVSIDRTENGTSRPTNTGCIGSTGNGPGFIIFAPIITTRPGNHL